MSAAQVVLAALQAAGGVCEIVCPACKGLVDVGEELAKVALTPATTEQEQVQSAEDAIFAADTAAVAALEAAHVVVTPSPTVSAVAGVVSTVLASVPSEPVVAAVQPAGTVKSWQ